MVWTLEHGYMYIYVRATYPHVVCTSHALHFLPIYRSVIMVARVTKVTCAHITKTQ